MITEDANGTVRYTNAAGVPVVLSIFDGDAYEKALERVSEQEDGASQNINAINSYNNAVTLMQKEIDAGTSLNPPTLPVAPKMIHWPDDPTQNSFQTDFPAGSLLTIHPAPTPTPDNHGLGPADPSRGVTPMDPALVARLDRLEKMLTLIYSIIKSS